MYELCLGRPQVCVTETYEELTRTSGMQTRLLSLGLMKKVMTEKDKRRSEVARLLCRYDRSKLYHDVWSQSVQEATKTYGISGIRLGKVCRILEVPVPTRRYWVRIGLAIRWQGLPTFEGAVF